MKVLYAIQGTGNGHLGRAMEIAPHLKERAEVDFLISGKTAELKFPFELKYNYHGIFFFFGKRGGVDYLSSFRHLKPLRLWRDIRDFPVKDYDLVITDFEPISAWAAKRAGVPVIALSHQASFYSDKVPLPRFRNRFFEYGMKHWVAPANDYVGLHYRPYDDQVLPPIIRKSLTTGRPTDEGHVTVYLPAYSDETLIHHFSKLDDVSFHIFTKKSDQERKVNNVLLRPVSKTDYTHSLLSCKGLITGGGFQSTSEALYLKKKLLVLPMWDQYEQKCNAAALRKMGVRISKKISARFSEELVQWLAGDEPIDYYEYVPDTSRVADKVMEVGERLVGST